MDWKYTEDNPLRVVTLCSGNSIVVNVLEAIFTQLFRVDADSLF